MNTQCGFSHRILVVALLACGAIASPAIGFDVFWTAGTGSWNTNTNWFSDGELVVPDIEFEDIGYINNAGTATLNAPASFDAGGLVLGQNEGETGTLLIMNNGSLNLIQGSGAAEGIANIGLGGRGTLEVQAGGALSTTSLDVNAGSKVIIGGSGAGAAAVASTGNMFLNGVTLTHGPGHTFTADGAVNFEGQNQYIVDLQAATHTTLATTGTINNVQGLLTIQTSGGYTPSVGDSWEILTATSIGGAGFQIDTALTTTDPGVYYQTRVRPGGNGVVMDLLYDAAPTLTVNTNSGGVSMQSASGTPFEIIGYSVLSEGGAINPLNWSSLADNAVTGWEEAGAPTAQALNELNAQGSLTLNASSTQLGNIYVLPQEFGDATGELMFEYVVDGATTSSMGVVEYTGTAKANNLLLTVDPATGEAQIQNSSRFTIDLLGYSVLSDQGALDEVNWESLESQAVASWDEATVANSEFALTELVPEGVATLTPGKAYSLGQLFQLEGSRDLELEFLLSIDGVEEIRQGVVEYGPIVEVVGLPGDYNEDGVVDSIDYAVWRENLGAGSLPNEGEGISPGVIDQDDFDFWLSRFGATSGAVAGGRAAGPAPVPEASCVVLLLAGMLAVGAGRDAAV